MDEWIVDGWMPLCLLNARLWIVCVRRGSETCVEISRRRRRRGRWSSRIGGTSLDAGDARRRSPGPPMGGCGPQISPNAAAASALLTLQLQRALPPVESTAYARTDRAPQTLLGRPHDSALFPVVDYVTASTWTHDRGPRPCYELDGQSGPLTPL